LESGSGDSYVIKAMIRKMWLSDKISCKNCWSYIYNRLIIL
jgi:hypothetical protein